MAGQRQFFAQLPPGKLNPSEVELRDVLHKAAVIAGSLLPRNVTLQDWVERRMPNELLLTVDAAKRVSLLPLPVQAALPAQDFSRDIELFFKRLPGDSFLPEEDRLREALMERLRVAPTPVVQGIDPKISAVTRDFLPSYVALADWVERRIGAEVSIFTNEHGQRIAKLGLDAPGMPKAQRTDDFFAGLPTDAYTPEEERLRNSIFDFLAGWSSQELATLTHIGGDKSVKQAKSACMPAGVAMREWIERRMGAELELRKDAKGQFVVHLTAAAHPRVRDRYEAKKLEEKGAVEPPISEDVRQKFFATLPVSELTQQELSLREKLLDFLSTWDSRRPGGPPPMISDAGSDPGVRPVKAALLPKGLPFKEWIDRRVGMEIETKKHTNGQDAIFLRGAQSRMDRERSGTDRAGSDRAAASREEAKKEQDLKKEAFLKTLPVDDFSAEELELRQALLAFLEGWPAGDPSPDLGKASQDPIVQSCRLALLPRGCGCGLQGWIDRRIGGEIETRTVGGVAFFGLRGQLSTDSVDSKKRKTSLDKPPVRAGPGGAVRPRR